MFFREVILDGSPGKTKYVIRVEFQVRGSPYIHSFLLIFNAPSLSKKWLDQMILAELPNKDSEVTLFEHAKNYQLHRHSKTYQKYRKGKCRFNFGRFSTETIIVAKPLSDSLTEHEKVEIILVRSTVLNKIEA